MERILVFSDTHGSTFVMEKLLESPPGGLTTVFHLGDGSEEAEYLMQKYPRYAYIGVKGNCDFFDRQHKETAFIHLGSVKIMLTHGHVYGVKSSLDTAAINAAAEDAALLLYGHTHLQDDRVVKTAVGNVRAVNPGTARMAEYAIITVDGERLTVELKKYGV